MKRNKLTALAMAGIMMASSFAGLTAFAEDGNTVAAPANTTGSVYVTIEKSAAYKQNATTKDYILAPTKVDLATVANAMGGTDALTPDDGITDITILDVLKTVYGSGNFVAAYNQNYHCYYVSSVKDSGSINYVSTQDDYVYGSNVATLSNTYSLNTTFDGHISNPGWLTENDLINNGGSGWMIAQNNTGTYYGVSTVVAANDVLRMEWTTFNGMDVGYAGYLGANWTEVAPFVYASSAEGEYGMIYTKVNKDGLVKWLVDESSEAVSEDINAVEDALKNIAASQTMVDTALPE